jgi:hypothetical protein
LIDNELLLYFPNDHYIHVYINIEKNKKELNVLAKNYE